MGKFDDLLKSKQAGNAAQAASELNESINSGSTHKDGTAPGQPVPQDQIHAEGQNVVVKDSVVTTGNKDNKVTAAVVNEAANNAPDTVLAPSDAHAANVQNAAGAAYMEGAVQTVAPDGTLMESSQQPRVVAPAEPSSAARTSNIVTGMEVGQPAAEKHASPIAGVMATEPMSPEVEANLAAKAKGVYQPVNLRRFHRKDGTAVEPQKGLFYAETEDDQKELDHFVKTGKAVRVQHTARAENQQVAPNSSIQDLNKK